MVRLHGFPKNIVLDKDAKFTSKFWKELFVGLGTELSFADIWIDREGQHDIGEHVEVVCDASTMEVGRVSPLGRVPIQQRLSRVIEDESF